MAEAPVSASDMRWRYQMSAYRLTLERMEIVQSMSWNGSCLDNANAENFFLMVKIQLYYDWEGAIQTFLKGIWKSTSTDATAAASGSV